MLQLMLSTPVAPPKRPLYTVCNDEPEKKGPYVPRLLLTTFARPIAPVTCSTYSPSVACDGTRGVETYIDLEGLVATNILRARVEQLDG